MANDRIDGVDTRVVEMQFDNKQFEKGAGQTLTTLEKLKKSLNFSNAGKGFDSLQKGINSINVDNITNKLSSVDAAFTTLAGSMKRNFFDRVSNEILDLGKQLYQVTAGQIVSGGKNRAMNIAQAKFKMEGMGVTWDQIKEDLDYAVSGTAYGLDAAANIASQLTASGIEVGDAMKTALRGVSGVAAMTSSSYEEIGDVFAAVAGQGKAMAMQLNQLSLRGINAASTIGDYLGKTEAEVRDMASKGQISFEIFSNAMDAAFGEHAKEANKTFTGAASNIRAALSKIGELFYGPFYNAAIAPLNTIRETISMIKDALVGGLEYVDTKFGLKTTAERLEQIVKVGGDIVDIVLKGIQNGIRNNLDKLQYLNKILVVVLRNLKSLRAMLITMAEKSLAKTLVKTNGKYYVDTVNNLAKIGGSYKNVAEYMHQYAQNGRFFGASIDKSTKSIKKQSKALSFLENVLSIIFGIVQGAVNLIKQILKVVAAIGIAFSKVFISVGGGAVGTVWNLVWAFIDFIGSLNISEKLLTALYTAAYAVFSVFKILVGIIGKILSKLGGLDGILSTILGIVFTIGLAIKNLIVIVVDFIRQSSVLSKALNVVKVAVGGVAYAFDSLSKINIQNVSNKITNFFNGLKNTASNGNKLYALKYIYTEFRKFIDYIIDRIPTLSFIVGEIRHLFHLAVGVLYAAAKKIKEGFDWLAEIIHKGWLKINYIIDSKKYANLMSIEDTMLGRFTEAFVSSSESTAKGIEHISNMLETMSDILSKTGEKLETQDNSALHNGLEKLGFAVGDVGGLFSDVSATSSEVKDDVTKTIQNIAAINNMAVADVAAVAFYNISKALRSIASGVGAISNILKVLDKAVKRITNAEAFKRASEGFIALGISLAIFVGTVVVTAFALEQLNSYDSLWDAILLISGTMLVIGILMKLLSKLANWHGAAVIWGAAFIAGAIATSLGFLLGMIILLGATVKDKLSGGIIDSMVDAFLSMSDQITKVVIWMSVATLLISLMYLVAEKLHASGEHIPEIIEANGKMLTSIGLSIIALSIGMAILSLIKEDKFKKVESLLTTMLVSMMVLAGLFIWFGKVVDNADSFEQAAKLLKQMTKTLLVMLAAVAIISAAFSLIGASGNDNAIASIILATVAVVGLFTGITAAVVKIEKESRTIKAGTLKAISSMITVFTVSIIAILAAVALMSYEFVNIIEDYGVGKLIASLIMVGGILYIALNAVYSAVNKVLEMSADTTKAENFKKMSVSILILASSLLVIAMSLALLTATISLSPEAFGLASMHLIGFMAVLYLAFSLIMKTAKKYNYSSDDLLNISKSFAIMAGSFVAVSLSMTILVNGLQKTLDNSPLDNLKLIIEIFGLMLDSVVVLAGALLLLTVATQKMDKGAEGMRDAAVGFAYIASSMAILVLALSQMAKYGSKLRHLDDVLGWLLGAVGTIGLVLGGLMWVQSQIPNATTTNPWVVGRQFAFGMLSVGLAAIAVAGAAKIIEEAHVKDKTIEQMHDMIKTISGMVLGIITLVGILQVVYKLFAKSDAPDMADTIKWTFIGISATLVAMGASMLMIAAAVKKSEKALATIEKAPEYIGILLGVFSLLVAGTLYGSSTGALSFGNIASAFAGLSAGMFMVAAGLAALAVAVLLFAAAVRVANGESLDEVWHGISEPEKVMSGVTNKTLVSLKKSGYITGEEYAEGFRRGLWDSKGELTNAGIEAGLAVNDGAREATDEHSPSRVAYGIGENYDIGLANGMRDNTYVVDKQARKLANSMTGSLTNALDTMKVDANAAENAATSMSDTFKSTIVEANNGFGDFKFDYSSLFDDAPFEANIVPVLNADDVEAKIEEQDSMLDLSSSLSGLTDSLGSMDIAGSMSSSLTDIMTDKDGNNFLDTIEKELDDPFAEDGPLSGLSTELFGEGGIDGLLDSLTEKLSIPDVSDLTSILDNSPIGGALKSIFNLVKGNHGVISELLTGGFEGVVDAIINGRIRYDENSDSKIMDILFGTVEQPENEYVWERNGYTLAQGRNDRYDLGPGDAGYTVVIRPENKI